MKPESIVFAVAGMCFGIILGWVIGAQHAPRPGVPATALSPAPAPAATPAPAGNRQPPTLDEGRVQALTTILKNDPANVNAQVQLANTYFDAERYDDAIKWYEQALKLDPKNVDASTDLGVSYYYTNRTDQALEQFNYSLKLNPKHTKTLLNQGIVLAFGKQNLQGASDAWKKVVELAPESPEGQAARRALEGVAAAHPGGSVPPQTASPGG
jgi:cytochrome c-type biogenesis protein CcmH/NrfG